MSEPTTLAEKRAYYKMLIKALESTNVPESGLELFTVGDGFRSAVNKLETELISLSTEPVYKEFIIQAPFGGGKTHFLRYLSSLVSQNGSKNVVISSLDMSRLSSAEDFENKVVRGMRTYDGKGYGEVLRTSYTRIIEQMQNEYLRTKINASPQDLNKIFETLLYFTLGAISEGVLSRSVFQLLGDLNPVNAFVNLLTGKTVANLASQARLNSSKKTIDFVDSYMGIIKSKDAPLSKFDEACLALAKEKELCHVIFRMLHLASYKSVVIFVDELETVRKFDETTKAQILTAIRDFRDRFSLVGEKDGYPSTGLVVASTSQFSGAELEKIEPALYDRWKRKMILLPTFTQADIDHLLFRLRDLFYLAGYRLQPLKAGDTHEIILLRRKIFEDSNLTERHPRDVIAELIKLIRAEWVIS
jgi:hypothetical protein